MKRTGPLVSTGLCFALALAAAMAVISDSSTAVTQNTPREKQGRPHPPELVEDDMVTRQAICRRAAAPPLLDGKLDDPCWQKAAVIDHFASFWTKIPRAGTFAYLVWDDDALYYAASMVDAELRSFGTKRNDTLWEGDVFELFFKPRPTSPSTSSSRRILGCLFSRWHFPGEDCNPLAFKTAPPLGSTGCRGAPGHARSAR